MSVSDVPKMFTPPQKKSDVETQKVSQEQEAQEDLMRIFPAMVCGDVQMMRQALVQAKGLYADQRGAFIQSRLLVPANRLKTQGTVFGYPLVSDVAAHLSRFIQTHTTFEMQDLNFMEHDLKMLQDILWKKIKGDGGEQGRRILNQLI